MCFETFLLRQASKRMFEAKNYWNFRQIKIIEKEGINKRINTRDRTLKSSLAIEALRMNFSQNFKLGNYISRPNILMTILIHK